MVYAKDERQRRARDDERKRPPQRPIRYPQLVLACASRSRTPPGADRSSIRYRRPNVCALSLHAGPHAGDGLIHLERKHVD